MGSTMTQYFAHHNIFEYKVLTLCHSLIAFTSYECCVAGNVLTLKCNGTRVAYAFILLSET